MRFIPIAFVMAALAACVSESVRTVDLTPPKQSLLTYFVSLILGH